MKYLITLLLLFAVLISSKAQCLDKYVHVDDSCRIVLPDYRDSIAVVDNCCLESVEQVPAPGEELFVGDSITVILTATDCSGNSAYITFAVMPIDTIPPVFICDSVPPPDITPPTGDVVRPRVIVLCDPNIDPLKESDDKMSLVRLMTYSDGMDIEGLVATVSHNLSYRYVEPILQTISAYEEVKPNLDVHSTTYPDPDALRAVTALGPELYGTTFALNESPISNGAQVIIDAINKEDERPIWVQVWGDGAVLAQALNYIRETEGDAIAQYAASKLRVLDIAGQDDSGAWLMDGDNFPDMFYVRWVSSILAMDSISDHLSWYDAECNDQCSKGDTYYTSDPWVANNVQNHGPLGAEYPDRRYIKEGDSPSMMYNFNIGLADHEQPWMGSWGGRMMREKQLNVRSRRAPLDRPDEIPESDADPYYMYAEDMDTWTNNLGNQYTSVYTPIFRWWDQFQNDFAARMDWTLTNNYDEANHQPVVKIGDDGFNNILYVNANAGEDVVLDASQSYDPDGDNLTYSWWQYKEAGTYTGSVTIQNSESSIATISFPTTANKEIHIIVSVTDNGNPNLTRYRRVVFTIK